MKYSLTWDWKHLKNSLREFSRFQARKRFIFLIWHEISENSFVTKLWILLAQRKENTSETNKMCHNNLWFTISFPNRLLPLAIPKTETNKTNPFSISSWNCLECDKTLRNSFVIMVLHFIGTSPEEVVNGCFQIHRAIKG